MAVKNEQARRLGNSGLFNASTYLSTDEGHEPWFSIRENVPSEEEQAKIEANAIKFPGLWRHRNNEPTLHLDMESLLVMQVTSATYLTEDHPVHRHQS